MEAWVLDQLAGLGGVVSRRMFGGAGLYREGVMFGLISGGDETLYFKVSEETRAEYEALGSSPFQPFEEGPTMSYFEVPADVIEDEERLCAYAERAFEVAIAARRAKKKAKRAPKKKAAKKKRAKRKR